MRLPTPMVQDHTAKAKGKAWRPVAPITNFETACERRARPTSPRNSRLSDDGMQKPDFGSVELGLDVFDGVANRHEFRCSVVGNVDVELLFTRYNDLEEVEAISSQILNKPSALGDLCFIGTEEQDKYVSDLCGNVGHRFPPNALHRKRTSIASRMRRSNGLRGKGSKSDISAISSKGSPPKSSARPVCSFPAADGLFPVGGHARGVQPLAGTPARRATLFPNDIHFSLLSISTGGEFLMANLQLSQGTDGRFRRSERTRQHLIETYLDLLKEKPKRPTADELAKRAGCSERSVFERFSDLRTLSLAAVDYALHQASAQAVVRNVDGDRLSRIRSQVETRARADTL